MRHLYTFLGCVFISVCSMAQDLAEQQMQLQDKSTALQVTEPVKALEESEDNSLYVMAEVMPEYPGGIDSMKLFIDKQIDYTTISKTAQTNERVLIEFVVEKNGELSNVAILLSSGNKAFDNEVLRIVEKMPLWQAGIMEGKSIRTKLIVPVYFKK